MLLHLSLFPFYPYKLFWYWYWILCGMCCPYSARFCISVLLCSTDMNKHSARFEHVCLHPQSIQLLSAQLFPVPPYGPLEASCHHFYTLLHIPLREGYRHWVSFVTLSCCNWWGLRPLSLINANSCLHWYSIHPPCVLRCPLLPTLKQFYRSAVLPEQGCNRGFVTKKSPWIIRQNSWCCMWEYITLCEYIFDNTDKSS